MGSSKQHFVAINPGLLVIGYGVKKRDEQVRIVDVRIIVTIMNWKDGSPRYIVSGSHNKFPAYEVYVNGEKAYRSDETKLEQVLDVTAALNTDTAVAVGQFSVLKKPGE